MQIVIIMIIIIVIIYTLTKQLYARNFRGSNTNELLKATAQTTNWTKRAYETALFCDQHFYGNANNNSECERKFSKVVSILTY